MNGPLLHVRDEKSPGTQGGTFTSGAWRTRTLNTLKSSSIVGAGLSSNKITLPAGSYHIEAALPANRVQNHQAKLWDVTNTADIIIGTSEDTVPGVTQVTTSSNIVGRFTLGETTELELRHKCFETNPTAGFGVQADSGEKETYAEVKIWQLVRAGDSSNSINASLVKATFDNVEIKRLSNASISIESARIGADDGTVIIDVDSPITVFITVVGENGRDGGSEVVSTWYYVYVIRNPTTGIVKGLLSTSPTNPTLPAGFTQKGLAGMFRNNSSGDIPPYIQYDDEVWHTNGTYGVLSSGTATAQTLVNLSVAVPPEATIARVLLFAVWGGAAVSGTHTARISSTSSGNLAALRGWYRRAGSGDFIADSIEGEVPLLTTQSIWYWNSNAVTGSTTIWISGFKFKRN